MTGSADDGLEPVSESEFSSFVAGALPSPVRADDGLGVIAIPLPEGHSITSTLCYAFLDGASAHLVDPGWGSDANLELIAGTLRSWGVRSVDSIVVTHHHPDHLGMAGRIREVWGARLLMGADEWGLHLADPLRLAGGERLDRWGVPTERRAELEPEAGPGPSPLSEPDVLLADGDELDLGRPLAVVATPGHTQGSISLHDPDGRRLLTGDHLLPHVFPGIGLGYAADGDPVGDYYESLDRTLRFADCEVLPGHGYRFGALRRRVEQTLAHHLRRTREVAAALERDPDQTVWEIASGLTWTRGWAALGGFLLRSALHQTEMHARFVRDEVRSARWLAER